MRSAIERAGNFIGITLRLRKEALTFDDFVTDRLGKYSSDDGITSLAEFVVQKITPRHPEPVKRILALTETCLVERDPASYNIVTIKPFGEVFALICDVDNPQVFTVEFIPGQIRKFPSTERDSLLASLLDGVRASGNRDVCVKMAPTQRGQRWGLLSMPVDEEMETLQMQCSDSTPTSPTVECCMQSPKMVFSPRTKRSSSTTPTLNTELESHFQAIRRLVASKAGFQAFTQLPKFREKLGVKTVKALKRNNNSVTHAAVDMLCALMCPMHDDYDLRQEQLNKASLLSSKKFLENLLEKFITNVDHGTGALVISALLDFLTFALCAPDSGTTEGQQFDMLLEMVASDGRTFFKLFQHPSMAIVKGAGLVMKAIIEEGDKEIATKMQDLALSEGALPRHLHTSLFTISSDQRMLTNRQLSRHLVGLWTAENAVAMNLLKRILPTGLLAYLDSPDPVPEKDMDRMHIRDNLKLAQLNRNKVPEWQRIAGKAAKEVEKFAKEKADIVLMHWRDKMGIAQKEAECPFAGSRPRVASGLQARVPPGSRPVSRPAPGPVSPRLRPVSPRLQARVPSRLQAPCRRGSRPVSRRGSRPVSCRGLQAPCPFSGSGSQSPFAGSGSPSLYAGSRPRAPSPFARLQARVLRGSRPQSPRLQAECPFVGSRPRVPSRASAPPYPSPP
ncbi:dnaJ homolog subfamily C member 13-like [Pseudoliparis swirei]|uniref:dnaJ homolog subfamily C member 13-like n=1 Tax=Pseudoliparis swirei TaxID=2059687 RepID=UPI0024BEBDCD|nr:dnaJ homolog subfamily C member 13-like [Pseudoliparis swirei]